MVMEMPIENDFLDFQIESPIENDLNGQSYPKFITT